jgi:hypothetical protein
MTRDTLLIRRFLASVNARTMALCVCNCGGAGVKSKPKNDVVRAVTNSEAEGESFTVTIFNSNSKVRETV